VRTEEDIQVEGLGELNRKSTVAISKLLDAMTKLEKRQTQMSQTWFDVGVAAQEFSKLIKESPKLNHDSENALSAMFGSIARGAERFSNITIRKAQEDSVHLCEPLEGLKRTGLAVEGILKDRNNAQLEVNTTRIDLEHTRKRQASNQRDAIRVAEEKQRKAVDAFNEITSRVVSEYHRHTQEKVEKLKQVLLDFVKREVRFREHSLAEIQKLQQDLASDDLSISMSEGVKAQKRRQL